MLHFAYTTTPSEARVEEDQTKLIQAFTTSSCPNSDLTPININPNDLEALHIPWTKPTSTLLPVCNSGCPTTICRNRCNPSFRCSITSSLNRLVKTLPGSGGIVTRALSRSRISLKYSKSLYLRLTMLCLSLKAGILVRHTIS
jgi:hypothetical protein